MSASLGPEAVFDAGWQTAEVVESFHPLPLSRPGHRPDRKAHPSASFRTDPGASVADTFSRCFLVSTVPSPSRAVRTYILRGIDGHRPP